MNPILSLLSKPLSIYNICRLRSGSNQPEALSIASRKDQPAQVKRKRTPIKKKLGLPKKKAVNIPNMPLDSPSMGTRSKAILPNSPAMSTRSKRRLSFLFMICLLNLLVVCETNVYLNSHSCVTLFTWDLIYVWLKLWWIYVRPYLCETWLIAMHVWKFLEHIMYCYVSYLLNITPNMYCYVYYILQICLLLCVNLFA
jgi:hypothetical protein